MLMPSLPPRFQLQHSVVVHIILVIVQSLSVQDYIPVSVKIVFLSLSFN